MKYFDLNIEKILENWDVYHAIREIIANALDEQIITNTKDVEIFEDENTYWHIKDYGRGLQYEHFTQNENKEKIENPKTIGKFGFGLKDGLATLDRHDVKVIIKSRYGDIFIEKRNKYGFEDVTTLHAYIEEPSDPNFIGTEFILKGCSVDDINKAKKLFMLFSGEKILEITQYGQVLEKTEDKAAIFLNGIKMAEEDDFLFSYNITSINKEIKKALNRERMNVGRTAYADRIKSILLSCKNDNVISILSNQVGLNSIYEELNWTDVAAYVCKIANSIKKPMFVTASDLINRPDIVDEASNEGYEIITVKDKVMEKIEGGLDLKGKVVVSVSEFIQEKSKSYTAEYIDKNELNENEINIFERIDEIFKLIGGKPECIHDIKIAENVRDFSYTNSMTLGTWDKSEHRIVIKRSQLNNLANFSGTLLHEMAHAISNASDVSRQFESQLTILLGKLAYEYFSMLENKSNSSINSGEVYFNFGNILKDKYEDYEESYKWYKKAADQGNIDAQYSIGKMYEDGYGVDRDDFEALKWYRKAAEHGNADAQFDLGIAYYFGSGMSENFDEAYKWFKKSADQGNISAKRRLGEIYYYGLGVSQDYNEAYKWFERSAVKEDQYAQYKIGEMYYFGYGVDKDYNEAYKWCEKSADQGNAGAQNMIGEMYYFGYGVDKDYNEALKWYKKAADEGDSDTRNANALFKIAEMYYYGHAVVKDYNEAYKWYKRAADKGNADAQRQIGHMYFFGLGVEVDYSESYKWCKKAANQENSNRQFYLGLLYILKDNMDKDFDKALAWLIESAEQGNADAQYSLGYAYSSNLVVSMDYNKAYKWFKRSSNHGNTDAQNSLGNMYYFGNGADKDFEEALKWYMKAAYRRNTDAQFNLALMYHFGYGIEKDYEEALKWYMKAAEQDNEDAQFNLGFMYYLGEGVNKDYSEALKWYKKAAEQGNVRAQKSLGDMYRFGYGVDEDYKEAKKWYMKVAKKCNLTAQSLVEKISERTEFFELPK